MFICAVTPTLDLSYSLQRKTFQGKLTRMAEPEKLKRQIKIDNIYKLKNICYELN